MKSDTPRTDGQYKEYARRDNFVKCVDIDFARQLERELNDEKNKVAHQGLILATLCDMVLGESAADRSNDALMRGVRKLLNDLDYARKDSERLEWLDARNIHLDIDPDAYSKVTLDNIIDGLCKTTEQVTIRNAIDAAIAQEGKNE